MPRKKKRVYRKRARTVSGKKRNKARNILYVVVGFIVFVSISIYLLNYINKGIKRSDSSKRITQAELDESVSSADTKLNRIISDSGFIKSEIVDKTVSNKSIQDLRWQLKEVLISTVNAHKIDKFENGLKTARLDNSEYSTQKSANKSVFGVKLHGLDTHRLTIRYKPVAGIMKTDGKISKDSEIDDSNEKLAFIPKADDKRDIILKPSKKSTVVIIVDDIGNNKESIDKLLGINAKLNFAVLPNLPYSKYAAEQASKRGWDVLLHLPMEPKLSSGYTGIDAGDGVLLTGLPKNEILNLLDRNLRSVPYIKGVNNHMGSKFTENKELMKIVLEQIKKNNLYFIDSRTSHNTVGYEQARKIGVKTAQRDIFLDENNAKEHLIRKRLEELINFSNKNGIAVGICHPYPNTIKVLSEALPKYEYVAEFASASSIVE